MPFVDDGEIVRSYDQDKLVLRFALPQGLKRIVRIKGFGKMKFDVFYPDIEAVPAAGFLDAVESFLPVGGGARF